ncbi:MAG: hypothetical protein IPP33_05535 [Flavobacteriales bacterium]|nr:hypothetical protein [Flavobacteriales bacterium]
MDGMMLDGSRQDLPFIHETRALGQNTTGFTAYLGNTRYLPLSEVELIALPGIGVLGEEPEIRTILGFERKKPIALIDIYPYRRNPSTGQVERLVDHSVQLVEVKRSGSGGPKSGVYPDNSKLASGNWYRFSVLQDGVYKITYQFLQELGIDMTSMSSDRINVYGNHAGQLPFKNSPFVPTDLLTNAIEVVDGGDGQFGPNDHLLFVRDRPATMGLHK